MESELSVELDTTPRYEHVVRRTQLAVTESATASQASQPEGATKLPLPVQAVDAAPW